jgi:plastocyanin
VAVVIDLAPRQSGLKTIGETMLFLLRSRAGFAVTASAMCVAALAGCSDSGGSSSSSTPSASRSAPSAPPSPSGGGGQAKITIKNFAFHPAALTVAPGTKVTVVNADNTAHTVTAGSTFNTGNVGAGKTVVFTAPSKAGTHRYICTIHPFMKGSLTVR